MCVETGLKKETGSGWRRIEQTGAIYCNVNLDRYGRILTAIISTSMGGYRAWKWPDFTKEAVDQDKDLEVAQYSFEIAEVLSDKIIQKRTGVIHFNWRPPVTVIMSEFP